MFLKLFIRNLPDWDFNNLDARLFSLFIRTSDNPTLEWYITTPTNLTEGIMLETDCILDHELVMVESHDYTANIAYIYLFDYTDKVLLFSN